MTRILITTIVVLLSIAASMVMQAAIASAETTDIICQETTDFWLQVVGIGCAAIGGFVLGYIIREAS